MKILRRIRLLIESNINAILEKAENPEKTINQLIRDMEQNVKDTKNQVIKAIADRKKMERQQDSLSERIKEWETKSCKALEKDDEELARQSIKQKLNLAQQKEILDLSLDRQTKNVEILKRGLKALEDKLLEANNKKNILIARKTSTQAQREIQEALSVVKVDTTAFEAFEKMTEKVEEMEDELEAVKELEGDSLEDKFKKFDTNDDVDNALEALKKKMKKKKK